MMKRSHGLLIIAAIAIIAFSMAACSDSGGDHDHKWEAWRAIDDGTPCLEERECLSCWAYEYRHIDAGCEGSNFLIYNISGDTVEDASYDGVAVCIPDINPNDGITPVTGIGDEVFMDNFKLRSVRIGENVENIGSNAFDSTALKSITIPAGVEYIGDYAFAFCEDLTTVSFAPGSKLETIDSSAFQNTAIKSITIPAGVENIFFGAFSGCEYLTTVTFASGSKLKYIDYYAFSSTALKSITIPASVEYIGSYAFACKDLTTVTFASDSVLETIGYAAFAYTALKSITIPSSVIVIGTEAFYRCKYLTTVTFASGSVLEGFSEGVFSETGLKNITIPATVEYIGNYAFYYCEDLTTVTMLAEEPPVLGGGFVFDDCTALTEIFVPAVSVDDYKTEWAALSTALTDLIVAIP